MKNRTDPEMTDEIYDRVFDDFILAPLRSRSMVLGMGFRQMTYWIISAISAFSVLGALSFFFSPSDSYLFWVALLIFFPVRYIVAQIFLKLKRML